MRIMGVDPGTVSMGYGIVDVIDNNVSIITSGAITGSTRVPLSQRLSHIYQKLDAVIRRFNPEEVAIEEPFVADNPRTALAVGRAQAVAMLVAAQHGLPVFIYSPTKIKLAVTSYGGSSKEQVQEMVKLQLGLEQPPQPNDAADALAVALCHKQQTYLSNLIQTSRQ